MRTSERLARKRLPLFAAVLPVAALAVAAALRMPGAFAADGDREYFISFKSRTYTDPEKGWICLPRDCLSFVRFHSTSKPRPLLASGWGKEGTLKLKVTPTETMAVIDSKGTGVIEFTEFAATGAADADAFACSDWARQPPRTLDVRIVRITQWEEQGNTMQKMMDMFTLPRKGDPPPPVPTFKALADLELACGTKTVKIAGMPVKIVFTFNVEQMWGFVRFYWLMTVTGSGSFRGEALGLTGADAGEIRFDLVTAGLRAVPPAHKSGDEVNMDADGTTATDLGVSHE